MSLRKGIQNKVAVHLSLYLQVANRDLSWECLQWLQLPSNFTVSHCKKANLTQDTAAIQTSVAPGDRRIQGKWNVNLFPNILYVNSALTTELVGKPITPPSSTCKAVTNLAKLASHQMLAICIYAPLAHLCPAQHSYSSEQTINIQELISSYFIQSVSIWFSFYKISVFSKAVCPVSKIPSADSPPRAIGSVPYAT